MSEYRKVKISDRCRQPAGKNLERRHAMHYRAETVFVKQGRVIGRLWKNLEAVDKTAANSEMQRRLDEENG